MIKKQIFELIIKSPVIYLTTNEGDQPQVRCVLLYSVDENGIIFHTGKMKDFFKQVKINPQVEMVFYYSERNMQVRVSGEIDKTTDNNSKDIISNYPGRDSLKLLRESGPLEDFCKNFIVYPLNN